jgi:hypothetical protein
MESLNLPSVKVELIGEKTDAPLVTPEADLKNIPVISVDNSPVENIYYNQDINQFYTKVKRRVYMEIEEMKPIAWQNVQNRYLKKNGEVRNYSYKYVNLQGHRLREDEVKKAIVYKVD